MPVITPLRILAVEGPAGSGKSTLINQLTRDFPEWFRQVQPRLDLQRPRDYSSDNKNGAVYSIIKDYAHFIAVVGAWRYDRNKIYLIDRFLWSQYVYGSFRLHHHTAIDINRGMFCAHEALEKVMDDYLSRSNANGLGRHEKDFIPEIKLATLFYMPPVENILHRREKVERKFPYKAEHERHHYETIIHNVVKRYDYPHFLMEEDQITLSPILKFFNITRKEEYEI